ncbi:MAG: ABC transporter permease subunit [Chloroflexi bacterium]|nr:ABC transporter permease subunit [Chloroflexota bacterium]
MTSRSDIFRQTLREQSRSLLWWSIGVAAIAGIYVLVYPAISDVFADSEELPTDFLQAFGVDGAADLATPEGFLNVELFSVTAPALLMIFAIARGIGAIAGSERSGEMELLLSNPISRRHILSQRAAAMLLSTSALGVVIWAVLASGIPLNVWPELSFWALTQASISLILLGWAFGTLAICASGITGNTGLSYGVIGAFAVATYLINGLAQSVTVLEPFRWLTPFHYYLGNDPLVNGIEIWHSLVLVAIIVGSYLLAVRSFDRRDLNLA